MSQYRHEGVVAGTLVATANGDKPIESLREGDGEVRFIDFQSGCTPEFVDLVGFTQTSPQGR